MDFDNFDYDDTLNTLISEGDGYSIRGSDHTNDDGEVPYNFDAVF